ncbi:hypothetical protein O0L34_g5370 [Tuta absoluta]|nr:hypothetical protein O0L34_g5370 [Tuta absoluta]
MFFLSLATTPLPFPACRADHIDCLRRGIRTFFFLMDSGYLGMKPVDPVIVNSVAVSMPEQDMSILMRRVNVTGAKWTKLADRKFNLDGGKSGIRFVSDLHLTGEITLTMASGLDPYVAYITMDIQDVESNITYPWSGERGLDNEDYIFIGPERIAVRNTRAPTFFIQPETEEAHLVNKVLEMKPIIVEHLSNEVTTAVMHSIIDNFRLFASKVPVKYYYKYF